MTILLIALVGFVTWFAAIRHSGRDEEELALQPIRVAAQPQ